MVRQQDSSPQSDQSSPNILNTAFSEDRSELEELREEPRKTQDALNSEREEVELQNQLHCRLSELEPSLQVCRLVQCVQ